MSTPVILVVVEDRHFDEEEQKSFVELATGLTEKINGRLVVQKLSSGVARLVLEKIEAEVRACHSSVANHLPV